MARLAARDYFKQRVFSELRVIVCTLERGPVSSAMALSTSTLRDVMKRTKATASD